MGDFRKKKLSCRFRTKKRLARKYLPQNGFVCRAKKIPSPEVSGKKILISLTNDHRTSRGRHSDVQL